MITVKITDLKIKTIIGTKKKERKYKQALTLDLSIKYTAKKAIASDDVKKAVDYEELSRRIKRKVKASRFFLIEALADFVLKITMEDKRIAESTVRINKPNALGFAKSVSVEKQAKR